MSVRARISTATTVGFDVGGTSLRAGIVDGGGRILDRRSVPTPGTAAGLEAGIVELVGDLRRDHPVDAIGLAVAGFLDPECETVRFAPHLPWRDAPVRERMATRLNLPVRLEHDANAAAWGEYRFGAARGAGTWVFFAVGTGIGATLMIDGRIYRGAYGTAPEFGHLTVVPDGRPCPCGKHGCLERYASGTALVDTARELLATGDFPDSPLTRVLGTDPGRITGEDIMAAARADNPLALGVLDEFGTWLGEGLAIVADVLDPELILLGGGVSHDAALYLHTARDHFTSRIVGAGHRPLPRVGAAELGSDAGMIGVADLARMNATD